MNFKPTLWKSVVSVISFITSDYYLASSEIYKPMLVYPSKFELMIDSINLSLALIPMLIIYLIWSLFQKKKKKR